MFNFCCLCAIGLLKFPSFVFNATAVPKLLVVVEALFHVFRLGIDKIQQMVLQNRLQLTNFYGYI